MTVSYKVQYPRYAAPCACPAVAGSLRRRTTTPHSSGFASPRTNQRDLRLDLEHFTKPSTIIPEINAGVVDCVNCLRQRE